MNYNRWKIMRLAIIAAIFISIIFAWRALQHVYYEDTVGSWLWAADGPGGNTDDSEVSPSEDYFWRTIEFHHPITSLLPIPTQRPRPLPKVQADFSSGDGNLRDTRLERQQTVKRAFEKCWNAYKEHAWGKDEVTPISGKWRNTFGGWGATLVDSLDTLWIMDMKDEFEAAVDAVEAINFSSTSSEQINVFETTIRFLGGFLSAYDLSGDKRLLLKAIDVGDMLMKSFDTPNQIPMTRWNIQEAASGARQTGNEWMPIAEVGSLSLEFTRLSIITGDAKYFTAAHNVMVMMERVQMDTKLPGMWSISANGVQANFDASNDYSLGGMSDSTYEYLIKMVALVGQQLPMYSRMYERAMETVQKHILFRPLTKDKGDMLISGVARGRAATGSESHTTTSGQHLTCFTGGMFALGGKLLSNASHLSIGEQLTHGCIWAYAVMPHGIMPETYDLASCEGAGSCNWSDSAWRDAVKKHHHDTSDDDAPFSADSVIKAKHLPPGFTDIGDSRYILRPEAIESVFVLYRATAEDALLEKAWQMWEAITNITETDLAFSAVVGVEKPQPTKTDSMESFWMGETLKYFYLIFSDPSLISLDQFVFNTEAHPLRRLK